jgi:hypothetical protein
MPTMEAERAAALTKELKPKTLTVRPVTEIVVVPLTDKELPTRDREASPIDEVLSLQQIEYVTSHTLFGLKNGNCTPPPPPTSTGCSSPGSVFTCSSHPLSFAC